MSQEPEHRMSPGLGVIEWKGRILVYQLSGAQVLWARFLGEDEIEVTDELRAAIDENRGRAN